MTPLREHPVPLPGMNLGDLSNGIMDFTIRLSRTIGRGFAGGAEGAERMVIYGPGSHDK